MSKNGFTMSIVSKSIILVLLVSIRNFSNYAKNASLSRQAEADIGFSSFMSAPSYSLPPSPFIGKRFAFNKEMLHEKLS